MTAIARRCVVGGSGIAGLMAARLASEFFDEVILLDRDNIPEAPNTRDGVPQGNHFHAILPGGLGIMSKFFSDLKSELLAAGALTCTVGRDFYSYWREGISYSLDRYNPNSFEGPQTFIQTRGLLEIRRNVEGVANVSTRYNTAMLDPSIVANRICGVRVITDGRADDIECDLCIDATGKAPRSIPWLQKLGFGRPEESVINTDFSYTSVFMKPHNWDAFDGIGFFVMRDPAGGFANRIGGVIKLEQGLWIAFLGGRFADYPPREMMNSHPGLGPCTIRSWQTSSRPPHPFRHRRASGFRVASGACLEECRRSPTDCCHLAMPSYISIRSTDKACLQLAG